MNQQEYEERESQLAHAIDRANQLRTDAATPDQADWSEANYQRALSAYEEFMNLPEHEVHNQSLGALR